MDLPEADEAWCRKLNLLARRFTERFQDTVVISAANIRKFVSCFRDLVDVAGILRRFASLVKALKPFQVDPAAKMFGVDALPAIMMHMGVVLGSQWQQIRAGLFRHVDCVGVASSSDSAAFLGGH